ncbi:MAG: AbrB/MazE/SpoVT family DNA-binding domain-containing protein [Chloroflexi bacterium]|nr:AbrB/MazE/SpoVT family DNA-binding domain-containing protein [Chloroflexota bacterium]
MDTRVSAKGWVVIPAEYRAKYNLKPGTRVRFVDYGGGLTLVRVPDDPIKASRGMLKGKTSLTEALLEERRKDLERDREMERRHGLP